MKITDQKDFAAGLFYLVSGAAVAIGATKYQVGTADRMGPGYFPLGIGLALVVVGICVLAVALRPHAEPSELKGWAFKRLAIVVASVALFGALIEPGGLVVAVPVLIGVSSLAHYDFSWRTALISTAVLLPMSWVIFIALLGLQLHLLPFFLRS